MCLHDARWAVRRSQQQVPYLVSDCRAQQGAGVNFQVIRRLFHGWIADSRITQIARSQHGESGSVG